MQITIDFQDKNVAKKVLWFLTSLKDKGIKIIAKQDKSHEQYDAKFQNLQISSMEKTWDNNFDEAWNEL